MLNKNEMLYRRVNASFENQNFLKLIGAALKHVEEGLVIISCTKKDSLTQQRGLIHGGVVATLADVACGYAALSTMPEGTEVLTVELKVNLIRPAVSHKIIATGRVIKSGRTLVITEATVTDDTGEKSLPKCWLL